MKTYIEVFNNREIISIIYPSDSILAKATANIMLNNNDYIEIFEIIASLILKGMLKNEELVSSLLLLKAFDFCFKKQKKKINSNQTSTTVITPFHSTI